jgi:hypothetical protein
MCMAIVPMAGLSSGVIAGVPFGVPFDRPARRPTGRAAFGDSLAGMPEELQTLLWEEFWQAVEPVSDFAAQTPPGTRHAPAAAGACGNWVSALSLPLVARAPAPFCLARWRCLWR